MPLSRMFDAAGAIFYPILPRDKLWANSGLAAFFFEWNMTCSILHGFWLFCIRAAKRFQTA